MFEQLPFTVPNVGMQNCNGGLPDGEFGYFQFFFSDDLLGEIVTETNRYASENLQGITFGVSRSGIIGMTSCSLK